MLVNAPFSEAEPGSGNRIIHTCMFAGVFGGVTVYTFHDIHFTVLGYVWLGIWYSFAVFEMVYVKKVVDTVEMTTWSRTYYQVTPPPSPTLRRLPISPP